MGAEGWGGFTSGCFKGSCRPWIDAERTRRSFFHVSILISITCWRCLEWRICSQAWIPICVDKSIRDQIRQGKKYCARSKSTQRHGLCHNFHLFSHFQAGGVWHGMPYVIKAARPWFNAAETLICCNSIGDQISKNIFSAVHTSIKTNITSKHFIWISETHSRDKCDAQSFLGDSTPKFVLKDIASLLRKQMIFIHACDKLCSSKYFLFQWTFLPRI